MQEEKSISDMNSAELRAFLAEFERSRTPAPAAAPRPPGITASMSPKAQETAAELYAASILAKGAGSWSVAEREFIRGNIGATLKTLGY
jgi:hypothetical protein